MDLNRPIVLVSNQSSSTYVFEDKEVSDARERMPSPLGVLKN